MKLTRLLITAPVAALGAAAAVAGLRRAVRTAVAAEFTAERAREDAEARAFFARREAEDARAEQEAQAEEEALRAGLLQGGADRLRDALYLDLPEPRPAAEALLDSEFDADLDPEFAAALRSALEDIAEESGHAPRPGAAPAAPPAEASVPDPFRHPSNPGYAPEDPNAPGTPDRAWTERRLAELCADTVRLSDVRPGPLGTLDLYVFEDATTLCVIPGDREVTGQLIEALRAGREVRLLGGSTIAGSFSLTFSVGDGDAAVFLLADRVVAST